MLQRREPMKEISFRIAKLPPKKNPKTIDPKITVKSAREFLSAKTTEPQQRWDLFYTLYAAGRRDDLLTLMTESDDAFAVIMQLEFMAGEWLNTESLKKLVANKDLAIRWAAMQAFSRLGKDASAAKWLTDFLKTQEDETTLSYGRYAVGLLSGRRKPAKANPVLSDGKRVYKTPQDAKAAMKGAATSTSKPVDKPKSVKKTLSK